MLYSKLKQAVRRRQTMNSASGHHTMTLYQTSLAVGPKITYVKFKIQRKIILAKTVLKEEGVLGEVAGN
jgi:hypothetical protein